MTEQSPRESEDGRLRALWPHLVVLSAVVVAGYLILDRVSAIGDRLDAVDRLAAGAAARAEDAAAAANDARDRAGAAMDRAVEAAENAAEAARGRDAAEVSRRLAEEGRSLAEAAMSEAEEAALRAEEAALRAEEDAARARLELDRVERERREELDRLETALGAVVETRRTALGLVMNLGSDAIEFEFDSAELEAPDRELLSRIAGILLTSGGFSVAVYGHTDDVGTDAYNQNLSERRAASVRDYLVEAGVDPAIISTRGYGKSSPRIEGTTAAARAENRRVEIAVMEVTLDPGAPIEPR